MFFCCGKLFMGRNPLLRWTWSDYFSRRRYLFIGGLTNHRKGLLHTPGSNTPTGAGFLWTVYGSAVVPRRIRNGVFPYPVSFHGERGGFFWIRYIVVYHHNDHISVDTPLSGPLRTNMWARPTSVIQLFYIPYGKILELCYDILYNDTLYYNYTIADHTAAITTLWV